MKKLVLIRHAQAEPGSEDLSDFDRPLTTSGKANAAKMAAVLSKKDSFPKFIISSPALRALTTAQIFTTVLGLKEVETNPEIYEANVSALLQVINALDDRYEVAGLVGHNPGVSNLLYFLTGKITTMQTCAWAEVELAVDSWAEVSSGTGKLLQLQHP